MSEEVVEYLKSKKVAKRFEYNFYLDIIKKRVLSDKQMEIKQRINKRFGLLVMNLIRNSIRMKSCS